MQFLPTLLDNLAYLNPLSAAGWLVGLGLAGMLGVALFHWRKYQYKLGAQSWMGLGALAVATLLTVFFIGWDVSSASSLPMPGLPEKAPGTF